MTAGAAEQPGDLVPGPQTKWAVGEHGIDVGDRRMRWVGVGDRRRGVVRISTCFEGFPIFLPEFRGWFSQCKMGAGVWLWLVRVGV